MSTKDKPKLSPSMTIPRPKTMNTFKVIFEDGNSLVTEMNADLEEARRYYGQYFNFGDTDEHPQDKMVKAIAVEQCCESN